MLNDHLEPYSNCSDSDGQDYARYASKEYLEFGGMLPSEFSIWQIENWVRPRKPLDWLLSSIAVLMGLIYSRHVFLTLKLTFVRARRKAHIILVSHALLRHFFPKLLDLNWASENHLCQF